MEHSLIFGAFFVKNEKCDSAPNAARTSLATSSTAEEGKLPVASFEAGFDKFRVALNQPQA